MAGRQRAPPVPPPPLVLVLVLVCVLVMVMAPLAAAACPPSVCRCSWAEGAGTTAVCANASLSEVPGGLAGDTSELRLDGNPLQVLTAGAFSGSGLTRLRHLHLTHCQLGHIDRRAFSGLAELHSLDLSDNGLLLVPADALALLPGLRQLRLSRNPIRRLGGGGFEPLAQLEVLALSSCALEQLDADAFTGLSHLRELRLDGNRLTTLAAGTLTPLSAARHVRLHDNPWSCDCRVRPLKQWLHERRPSQPEEARCAEPLRLRDSPLGALRLGQFSCAPVLHEGTRRLTAWAGDNITLSCSVSASPEAAVVWLWRGKLVTNGTAIHGGNTRFHVFEHGKEDKTSMMTIEDAQGAVAGQYTCEARNAAGRVSRVIKVGVTERGATPHLTLRLDHGVLAGVLAAGLLLALAGCLCLCLVCARARRTPAPAAAAAPATEAGHKNGTGVANGRPAGAAGAPAGAPAPAPAPVPVQTVVHANQTNPAECRTETAVAVQPTVPAPAGPAPGPPVATVPPEPSGWAPDVRLATTTGAGGDRWPVQIVYAPTADSTAQLVHTCGRRGGSLRNARRTTGHWKAGSDSGVMAGCERDDRDETDVRDLRDVRDMRDVRGVGDVRDLRGVRDVQDVRDIRDVRNVREVRYNSLPRCGSSRARTPVNLSPFSDLSESSPSPERSPRSPESGRRSAALRGRRRRPQQRPSLPSSPVLSAGDPCASDSGGTQLDPYEYHAVQLDRYLQEYRTLQDQLTAMQNSCHSLTRRPPPPGRPRRSLPAVRPDTVGDGEPPPPPSPVTVRQLKPILKSQDHAASTSDPLAPRRAPRFATTNTYFSYSES